MFCFVLFLILGGSDPRKESPALTEIETVPRNVPTSHACSCCLLPALGQSGTYTAQHRVLVGGGCGLSSQEAERPAFCKAKA